MTLTMEHRMKLARETLQSKHDDINYEGLVVRNRTNYQNYFCFNH